MKQSRQGAPCAGSLTPELEGAARSTPHPIRAQDGRRLPENKKDGARYE